MIDLHMHSYYSDDGEFQPEELVQKCKEEGIRPWKKEERQPRKRGFILSQG